MSREMLKNYCLEATTSDCVCAKDVRCGGITAAHEACPEHGFERRGPVDIVKTHFHRVQEDDDLDLSA